MASAAHNANSSGPVRVLRAFFGLLTLVALTRQLGVTLALSVSVVNFFSYYTILSNLFAGCVMLLSAMITTLDRRVDTLRFIAVVNMTLVGLVFVTLLRKTDLGPLLPWVNLVHHYLMPCVVLIDWLAVPPRMKLGKRALLIALAFPLAYLIYSIVRGNLVGWYPYPFLNAGLVGGSGGVAMYAFAITVVFCIAGSVLLYIGNQRQHGSSAA